MGDEQLAFAHTRYAHNAEARRTEDRLSVEEGRPAPDFTLASDAGEDVSPESLRGKPVVLYFYPKDDTRPSN